MSQNEQRVALPGDYWDLPAEVDSIDGRPLIAKKVRRKGLLGLIGFSEWQEPERNSKKWLEEMGFEVVEKCGANYRVKRPHYLEAERITDMYPDRHWVRITDAEGKVVIRAFEKYGRETRMNIDTNYVKSTFPRGEVKRKF